METKDKKLLKVRKNLHKISSDKLDEVNDFLEFLLKKNKNKKKHIQSLEGFWSNLGLEKIKNCEEQLRTIRKELSNSYSKVSS